MQATLRAYKDSADKGTTPWRVDVNGKMLRQEPYQILPCGFANHLQALQAGDLELRRLELGDASR